MVARKVISVDERNCVWFAAEARLAGRTKYPVAGAGDGTRTRDNLLGRQGLFH